MKNAINLCGNFIDKIINIMKIVTGYGIFAFMALLFFQVCMRFIFNNPIYGIDETVTLLMIWTMAIGWCTVYWDNEHAVLEFVMKKTPQWFKRIMYNITNLIVLTVSLIYIPGAKKLFEMQLKMAPVGGLPFPKAYYYALPIWVMSAIMIILCSYKTIAYVITADDKIVAPVLEEDLIMKEIEKAQAILNDRKGGNDDDGDN
jgi:TRAP-type C4-dicarboxylate transport system permease small subunit